MTTHPVAAEGTGDADQEKAKQALTRATTRTFTAVKIIGVVAMVMVVIPAIGEVLDWVPPFARLRHPIVASGSRLFAHYAQLDAQRARAFWRPFFIAPLIVTAIAGGVYLIYVWTAARRVYPERSLANALLVVTLYPAGVGLVLAGFIPLTLWLGNTFGLINSNANGLVAIFTCVYVIATIAMVWQNERARQTQIQIAEKQASNQTDQDRLRDETAKQTSEALAKIAESLALLTTVIDSQKPSASAGDTSPPANGHRSAAHNTEGLTLGPWRITRR